MYKYATEQDFQADCNDIKEMVVKCLVREKLMKKEDADKFLEQYVIMVYKKEQLEKIMNKKNSNNEEITYARIVKAI